MPSLIWQVEQALLALYKPGLKKHQLPLAKRQKLIVGARTLEVYLRTCCQFAKWCRTELHIKRLTDAHLAGQIWVQAMIDAGRSPWTVAMAVSALQKLARGVEARWGRRVTFVVPEALVGRQRRLLALRRRRKADGELAYPEAHLESVLRCLEPPFREAVEAVLHLGLRRREVVSLRAGDVDLRAASFAVKGRDGAWTVHPLPPGYAGVVQVRRGKGGRPREVPVPLGYRDALEARVRTARDPAERLFPVQAQELTRAVARACAAAGVPCRGVHGFRHTWALRQFRHLQGLGYVEVGARQMVSWWLGHNRLGVTVSYIPRVKGR